MTLPMSTSSKEAGEGGSCSRRFTIAVVYYIRTRGIYVKTPFRQRDGKLACAAACCSALSISYKQHIRIPLYLPGSKQSPGSTLLGRPPTVS